ncbi:diaminopimelate epimerase [candidate division KSB1 bacterium]|nr:diaminopimelate epimerase [candidate division KSB1 bacterium]
MQFYKYHGLGNDYLVMNPSDVGRDLTREEIIAICHRNYGVGSDGILWGPSQDDKKLFDLRIINPDASEAEKSGNGLRIFSRYLWDQGCVKLNETFEIHTPGGIVQSKVMDNGRMIHVEMGQVSFDSRVIPVQGPDREVLNETITVQGEDYTFCAATIGNPHCVILVDEISENLAKTVGPDVETDPRFPNRTNVQFMKVMDRNNIQIEIWERGAGYTLASGSSSSAAAAVAYKLGLCDSQITVHMPGGALEIIIDEEFGISMTGPVTYVGSGKVDEELFSGIPKFLL